ncbi:MAG: DUF11 domain-containing protein [Dokdonella sp.]|nr:DUF11 domain-containing protein [Dokdonella sp.]
MSLTTGLALVIGLPGWSAAQPDGLQQRGDADVAGTACTSTLYLSQLQGNPNTTLFEVNTRVSPLVFDPLGSGSHLYNAIGFNPVDNQLYAMNTGGSAALNMLLQVASNGATTELGLVSGLPAVAYNSGTVGSDGVYYVKPFGNTNVVYAIDLVARTATAISLSTSFTASDMGWVGGAGGSLYSVSDSGQLYSISASGTVTAIGPATGGGVLGAQFGAVNGLFGSSNDGGLFRIDLTTGARSLISGSPASGSNDGANCPNAPVQLAADLSVTKTSPTTTYAPGASVSYTILVRNEGPFAAEDVTVDDPLPAGISAASWTCSGSGGGVCGAASGTGAISDADVILPAGGSVTYALTLQVPPGFTGPLVNTASVLPGIGTFDPDSSNDSDSVTHEPEGTGPTPTPACGMSTIETFGSTTTAPTIGSPGGPWGPPLSGTEGTTEYTYRGSWQIVEGEYARVVSPASGGNPSAWVDAGDHTTDPAGAYGYMLIIDSSDAPGVFYSKTFVGLQIGARYTMSAAIANIVGAGNLILPNVQMRVVDAVTGSVIGQNSTGPLPQAASLTGPLSWSNPELSFDATTTSVRIELVNFQANAGSGNDLAVDDVGLRRDCVTLVKALTSESGGVTGTAEPGETLVYTITLSNSGVGAFTDYTFDENVPLGATLTAIGGAGVSLGCTLPLTGNASCPVTVASVPAGGSTAVSVTFAIADPIPSGVANIVNSVSGGHTDCGAAGNTCSVTTPVATPEPPDPTPAPACGMSTIETFGSTTTAPTIGSPGGPWGPPLSGTEGTTEYTYRGSWQIVEGEYARVVSPASGGNPSAWVDAGDHTTDPAGAYGYMLIIDSSDAPGVFYSKTFVGLQIGARYTMSAAIANIVGAGNLILPNVQMRVVDAVTGSVIGQNSTGPLPQAASLTGPLSWSNPELSFDATTTSVRIELVNFQANAGSGNDLAVDDVGLRRDCVTLVKALTSESGGVTGTAEPGETLVYTITLSNSGVGAFTDYTFDENVPLGATLTGIGGAGVSLGCTLPLTGNASCPVTVASVPAGGSTAVSVTFAIADPIPAGVANIVNSVSGGHTDCGAAGNVCSVTTPVAGGSVVALTKTVTDASGNGIAEPGETLTYQITLTNTGSSAATGYDVTDQLDPNTSFVSATNGGAHAAGIITWTGLTVPAQVGATPGTLVLTVAVTVNTPIPSGVTRIVNQAMPTGTAPPTCSATPTPAGCAIVPTPSNVRLVKVLSGENGDRPGLAEPGETLTYTITLTDLGGGGFPNYAFVENVPLGATLTAVSGAGVTAGCGLPVTGAGSCPVTVASVPAGGSTTVLVTFVVSDPIPAGVTSIVNTVNQGDTGCAEAGNACSVSTAIAGGAPPDVVPVPVNSRLGLLLLALAILAVAGLYRNGQRFER